VSDEQSITVRIPRGLHEQIEQIAEREHRTVSGQVRAWLTEAVTYDRQREAERRLREDRAERDRWGEP
jgi:hypothetical protein